MSATTNQTKTKKMKKPNRKPLLVTTAHKGVFFGYGERTDAPTIELSDARMCVYWTSDCKGVLGLAATGPTKSCRIGPKVPVITLRDVSAVVEVTEEAATAWEKGPWN